MPQDAKLVKIFSLIALAMGLIVTVMGIVALATGAEGLSPKLTVVGGILTLVLAARMSMLVNVPSNASKVVSCGLGGFLGDAACAGASVGVDGATALHRPAVLCVCALVMLLAVLMARRVVKRLEQA